VSIKILMDRYGVSGEKVAPVYHGVPDMPLDGGSDAKRRLGLDGRVVVLTFGRFSPHKGIETATAVLPPVVAKRADLLYVVLGATHPEVKKHQGERYRESLQQRVSELGLQQNVLFVDEFVALETLLTYIAASDLYVTPYLNREQAVSGTLSYALAAGKPIISTPYWYAEELLGDGRGVLVPFRDPQALSEAMLSLIEDPGRMEAVRQAAYRFGRQMVWSEVGKAYAALFYGVIKAPAATRNGRGKSAAKEDQDGEDGEHRFFRLPPVKLDHLKALTDDTGLIQHATYGVSDRFHGYSTDDVGRALVALLELDVPGEMRGDVSFLASRFMSFLQYAQTPSGHFHNFMGFDRKFRDEHGSDDTLGRAVWGLGCVVRHRSGEGVGALAQEMLRRALEPARALRSPRGWAYVITGLALALSRHKEHQEYRQVLSELAGRLLARYQAAATPDWRWFEERITYGNAKMSEALLLAYQITGNVRYKEVGLTTLDFLLGLTWTGSYFDLIGNQGWIERGKSRAIFSQQPIDAGYLVEACDTAYQVTKEARYLEMARAAFAWFLGQNRLGVPLYDEE